MDKAEWQRAYDSAGSIRALSREMGISPFRVKGELRRLGIPQKDSRVRRQAVPPTREECESWARAYADAPSVSALARERGVKPATIRYHLLRCGVPVRRSGFKSPKSVSLTGPRNSNWRGGTYRHTDGYVLQYAPSHPYSVAGYVLQHRLVMEQKLGRFLEPWEIVHHVNEVKDDNRPENLALLDRSSHMKLHKTRFPRDENGRFVEVRKPPEAG